MTIRDEEFMRSIGNDSPGHEFYDDVDFEEVGFVPADQYEDELLKYPIVKRYIKQEDDLKELNDKIEKGGLNENGKSN